LWFELVLLLKMEFKRKNLSRINLQHLLVAGVFVAVKVERLVKLHNT
jgi:hypothetical protein